MRPDDNVSYKTYSIVHAPVDGIINGSPKLHLIEKKDDLSSLTIADDVFLTLEEVKGEPLLTDT